jgi:hypothetical protein
MKSSNNKGKPRKSYRYWLRVIHRDLGFVMIGTCFIYGISGILLNHMDGEDPSYKVEGYSLQVEKSLRTNEVKTLWEDKKDLPALNKVIPLDDTHYRLLFSGGTGVYDAVRGTVDYEKYTKRQFVYWINKLHYNKVKGWSVMADFFAVSLIFFAVSGLFIVKREKGMAGSGTYYLIAGILIPVIYIIIG